jgi:hypothetical protein
MVFRPYRRTTRRRTTYNERNNGLSAMDVRTRNLIQHLWARSAMEQKNTETMLMMCIITIYVITYNLSRTSINSIILYSSSNSRDLFVLDAASISIRNFYLLQLWKKMQKPQQHQQQQVLLVTRNDNEMNYFCPIRRRFSR